MRALSIIHLWDSNNLITRSLKRQSRVKGFGRACAAPATLQNPRQRCSDADRKRRSLVVEFFFHASFNMIYSPRNPFIHLELWCFIRRVRLFYSCGGLPRWYRMIYARVDFLKVKVKFSKVSWLPVCVQKFKSLRWVSIEH